MKKWEPFSLKGMAAAWVKPDWPHDRRRVILYCHGGGYTSGNLGYSRPLASKLTNATGWETLCFEYRLGSGASVSRCGGRCPKGVGLSVCIWAMALGMWWWRETPQGEILALVLCHQLKEAGRQLPGRLVLMSPWTDMTASGRSDTQRGRDGPHHHYGRYSGSAGSLRGGRGSDLAHARASVWKF